MAGTAAARMAASQNIVDRILTRILAVMEIEVEVLLVRSLKLQKTVLNQQDFLKKEGSAKLTTLGGTLFIYSTHSAPALRNKPMLMGCSVNPTQATRSQRTASPRLSGLWPRGMVTLYVVVGYLVRRLITGNSFCLLFEGIHRNC